MNDRRIQADSFVVPRRRIRIYRVQRRDSATILWVARDAAVRYLIEIQSEELRAKQGR